MKVVSLILARGGSKEIPGKNLVDICGKPLISYSIQASLGSRSMETWVSTDCEKIKSVSESYGAKVIMRPAELATDHSKSEDSLLHFIENISCDVLVFIQPTSPFLKSSYINKGISMVGKYDSIFSAYKQHWIPVWSKNISPYDWDIEKRPMRQDVDYKYIENGAFYITTNYLLSRNRTRYSGSIGVVEMPVYESIQIDSYDDLVLAESIMRVRNSKVVD